MDLDAYLARIAYDGDRSPTLETLRAMHRAHFYNVPFENLDISRGVRIEVDEAVNFDKIVRRHRGGFCLELTGLFARALRQMGYTVDVLGARVMGMGHLSEPMSHMVSIVHLDESWIADVGFGGRVIEPLLLNERAEQVFGERRYVVENDGDHYFVACFEPGQEMMPYTFTLQPREFHEFAPVCNWLQTAPTSHFTQGDMISLATPSGRQTLAAGRIITTEAGNREEREVTPDEATAILRDIFGIDLPAS